MTMYVTLTVLLVTSEHMKFILAIFNIFKIPLND